MSEPNGYTEQVIREIAYFIWEREGCPEGCAEDHWERAIIESCIAGFSDELSEDEEKVLAGQRDANMPALLTKDVPGG